MEPRHCVSRLRALSLTLAVAVGLGCAGDQAPPAADPWIAPLRAGEQAFRQQQLPQAETAFRQALQAAEASSSAAGRVAALEGLATCRAVQGDMAGADSLYRIVLDVQEDRFAADSLGAGALVRVLGSLGEICLRRERAEEAEVFFGRILELSRSGDIDLLPEEPALAYTLRGLGLARAARGDSVGATALQARALGLQLYAQGFGAFIGDDLPAAEEAFRRALEQQTSGPGATAADAARTAHNLGRLLHLRGQDEESLRLYERAARAYAADGTAPIDHAAVLRDWAAALPASARTDSLRRQAAALLDGLAKGNP